MKHELLGYARKMMALADQKDTDTAMVMPNKKAQWFFRGVYEALEDAKESVPAKKSNDALILGTLRKKGVVDKNDKGNWVIVKNKNSNNGI